MKRDLQAIIKEAAERYGLNYNPNQKQPAIRRHNGNIEVISKENFNKAFGITVPNNLEKWSKIPGEELITWESKTSVDIDLYEDMSFFQYSEAKIVA